MDTCLRKLRLPAALAAAVFGAGGVACEGDCELDCDCDCEVA